MPSVTAVLDKLTKKKEAATVDVHVRYRGIVSQLASEKKLTAADEAALAECMDELSITRSNAESDVKGLQQYRHAEGKLKLARTKAVEAQAFVDEVGGRRGLERMEREFHETRGKFANAARAQALPVHGERNLITLRRKHPRVLGDDPTAEPVDLSKPPSEIPTRLEPRYGSN